MEKSTFGTERTAPPEAYRAVLEDLSKVQLYQGKYDAVHGNEHFMFGIVSVIEFLENGAGYDEEYSDAFLKNMGESEKRAEERKQAKRKEKK